MIAPKTTFLPGKSSRASAYAPIDAVTRISTVCSVAAAKLFHSHRKIGCWPDVSSVWYASSENGSGNEYGARMASDRS